MPPSAAASAAGKIHINRDHSQNFCKRSIKAKIDSMDPRKVIAGMNRETQLAGLVREQVLYNHAGRPQAAVAAGEFMDSKAERDDQMRLQVNSLMRFMLM